MTGAPSHLKERLKFTYQITFNQFMISFKKGSVKVILRTRALQPYCAILWALKDLVLWRQGGCGNSNEREAFYHSAGLHVQTSDVCTVYFTLP